MERARQEGARSIDINLLDLKEMLSLADAGAKLKAAGAAKYHAGWAKPGSLYAMNSGKKLFMRISRRRSDDFSVQLFLNREPRDSRPESDQEE
jgi:hypothetical protein